MSDHLTQLGEKLGIEWPSILEARQLSREEKQKLEKLLVRGQYKFVSDDNSIVAFGSLAREEWTAGSDLDWQFLVDGQADPQHRDTVLKVNLLLKESEYKPPGRTGVFGNMAFSHDLIHHIGDEHDTSTNVTRRILMLLESYAVGGTDADTYSRVVRQILNGYFREQWGLIDTDRKEYKVPLFLLNDMVRFWRTMAVEFAGKQRERGGEGFGLRNAKLRMSRKLIFVAGLLTCLSCKGVHLDEARFSGENAEDAYQPLVDHVMTYVKLTPLEILAKSLLESSLDKAGCRRLLDSYNEFLSLLGNPDVRVHLEKRVTPQNASSDPGFQVIRKLGWEFQEGLENLFFSDSRLAPLSRRYGIF